VQLLSVRVGGRRDAGPGRARRRWLLWTGPVLLALTLTSSVTRPVAAQAAANPVETAYAAPGPYPTTTAAVTDPANSVQYDLYRPADYSALGFRSPIVTWGDGTNATPDQYSDLLSHLASYGFTVVAPDLKNTGSGVEIAAAARYLTAQNGTTGSVFQGHLDVTRVAAAGHSQGAGGAVQAAVNNPSLISAVLTFSLPNTKWVGTNADCATKNACLYTPARLTQPTFLAGTHGTLDSIIASVATEQAFYQQIPGHATLGLLQSSAGAKADHNTIQDSGGPAAFYGYATAWLAAQLRGDTTAAAGFSGAHPEIVGNANWPSSAAR
jgi:predicted dienelactone hydrolase